ncbi:Hypp8998 [Branchiostoma lanceolatum]|uniref:Hypp8998 protein n=1 Tax=Branchiostoma lanceolatum TaxID=7740 RepID=A0A8K0EGX0_BRALA|nr:Hypp8998 [Branchiostoma lanceolatum]
MRSASSPVGAIRAPCPTPATPYRIERRMESSKSRERMSRTQRELSSVEIMAISERETFEGLVDISGKQIHGEKQQKKAKGQNSRGTLLVLKLPAVTMVSDDNSKPLMMAKNDGTEEKERSSLPYVRHSEVKGNVPTKVSKAIQTFTLPDLDSKERNDMAQLGLFGDGKKRAGISDSSEKEADRRRTQPVGKIRLWKEVKKKDETRQHTEKKPGKRSKGDQKWEWSPRSGRVFPEIQRSVTVEMNGRLSRINMEETLTQTDVKTSHRRQGDKAQLSPESSFDAGSVTNKSRKSSTKSEREETETKAGGSGGSSPRVVLPEIPPKLVREKTHEIERKTKKHRRKPSADDASSSHSVVLRTSSDNGLTVDAKHIMPLPKVTVPQTKMASQGERKTSDKGTEYEEPAYIAKLKRREKRRKELYDLLRYLPPLSKVSRTYAVNVISLGIDKDSKTEVEGEGSEGSNSPGDTPRFPPCTCSHRTVAHPGIKISKSVSPRCPYLSKMADDLDEDKMADPMKTRRTVSERTTKRAREEELSKRTALGMFRTIQLFENRKRGPVDKRYRNIYRLDPRYLNKRASREKGG